MLYCKDFIGKKSKYLKKVSQTLLIKNQNLTHSVKCIKSVMLFIACTLFSTNIYAETCTKFMNATLSYSLSGIPNEYDNINDALLNSTSGDVVCFRSGVYPAFKIDNIEGGNNNITLMVEPEQQVEIKNSNYRGTGITITNSKNIVISNFTISGGLYGIYAKGSSDLTLENNHIFDVGQEAIAIKSGISKQPLNNFTVKGNTISDTGKTNSQYGEGIYIGDGNDNFNEVLRNVSIKNNHITNVTNEAVDIKINVKNIDIHSNTMIDTNLKFNGVITVATSNRYGEDSNVNISHNLIRGVINRSGYSSVGIAVGQGNAVIDNNVIIENNKKFIGICLYSTFMNNNAKDVIISNNEVITQQGRAVVTRCSSGGTGEKEYANVTVL